MKAPHIRILLSLRFSQRSCVVLCLAILVVFFFLLPKMVILSKGTSTKELESKVKNKWRWEWLNCLDELNRPHGLLLQKWDALGKAHCIICKVLINYGSNGKKVFCVHSETEEHWKGMQSQALNQTVPGTSTEGGSKIADHKLGHHSVYKEALFAFCNCFWLGPVHQKTGQLYECFRLLITKQTGCNLHKYSWISHVSEEEDCKKKNERPTIFIEFGWSHNKNFYKSCVYSCQTCGWLRQC